MISTLSFAQNAKVGEAVYGDFNGDGVKEYAFAVQTQKGIGNAIENGVPGSYAVYFSTEAIPEIPAGCCEIVLVNEGDLNGDGADDISLYQAPMNGNTYTMQTMSLKDTTWQSIVPLFMIPTGGTPLTNQDLQNRIFLEDGQLYYLDTDVNDENLGLIRREVNVIKK